MRPSLRVHEYNNSYSRDLQDLIVILCDFVIMHKFWGIIMDKMLTRILSLVPKKPDGTFKHGALKDFAQSIGLKSGNLISDWINGRSASYKNYIYKISSVYGVSVEWLKGDTDEKMPSVLEGEGLSAVQHEAVDFIKTLSDEQLRRFIAMGKAAFDDRG